jgi:hypothetical protein
MQRCSMWHECRGVFIVVSMRIVGIAFKRGDGRRGGRLHPSHNVPMRETLWAGTMGRRGAGGTQRRRAAQGRLSARPRAPHSISVRGSSWSLLSLCVASWYLPQHRTNRYPERCSWGRRGTSLPSDTAPESRCRFCTPRTHFPSWRRANRSRNRRRSACTSSDPSRDSQRNLWIHSVLIRQRAALSKCCRLKRLNPWSRFADTSGEA